MENKSKADGMNYAPKGCHNKVVLEGEFVFSVAKLKHGHIYGMTNGLIEAGATLKYVFDDEEEKVNEFLKKYPQAQRCESLEKILEDKETNLVASADITNKRADLGIKVMKAGKDYFTDKAPFTTLEQIENVKKIIEETKRKYLVYYSELIHVESAVYAKQLVDDNLIGEVVQVLNLGPHRLNASNRPDWFFDKEQFGGILCDIGSHNIYQFLEYCNVDDAKVISSAVGNYNNSKYPKFEDFGDAKLISDKGHNNYFRVDWFTPDGLGTWGDGRLIILGTEGYIEVRKYIDPGVSEKGDNVILVNKDVEVSKCVEGEVGFPFFGEMILDCINRTEISQKQTRAIKAAELSIIAQNNAEKIK